MLKFYFNTMTKTRFTLKYSRIHSAQACSSKVEWGKKKAKFLYKGLAFPFSPLPSPLKFLYFFSPHLVSNPGKVVLWLQTAGWCFFFFFLLFLQMLPKWTEGWCYFTSTDFQKKTLIPWSTHALPLKSRFWAQKEIVCIYFIWLSTKKGDVWGKNVCSPRPAPTIQSSLLHSTKPKSPSKGRVGTPGEQILFTDTGRWSLIRSGLTPKETSKQQTNGTENRKQNHSRTRWIFTWVPHRQKISNQMGGRATVNN